MYILFYIYYSIPYIYGIEETKRIKLRVKELREERIEDMAKRLEEAKGDNQFTTRQPYQLQERKLKS